MFNAVRRSCRRCHKGGFNAGGATAVPEGDGISVASASPDMALAAQSVIKRSSLAHAEDDARQAGLELEPTVLSIAICTTNGSCGKLARFIAKRLRRKTVKAAKS